MTEREARISIHDNHKAAAFFGVNDENLRYINDICSADIFARGGEIYIRGSEEEVEEAYELLHRLMDVVESEGQISINDINYYRHLIRCGDKARHQDIVSGTLLKTARGKPIKAKTLGQKKYIEAILENDIVFGIGPAGTGKTYLAAVMAVRALKNREVERIILVRPAVEAGEKLGFLPGDFIEKVNPYLRPLYDGLFDILGVDVTQRYLEKNIIEIAPLAYMRGRTLNNAFIILDEAQNTTPQQMKMFLTRLGFGSKAVITGDVTQVDLPKEEYSGLIEIQKILKNVEGIAFQYLTKEDVIRHPLVQKIIDAYEAYEAKDLRQDK
ncbi:phosphate starvation-inducible protein PhoH [Thermosyntropha lipolytica DSM 11003]|uniref:PhoH-like protein n=1 Tax=Thermosyntropha lipolytica DSM 11003 TaxID=1123382 RepID=A0A1M5N922_9FIRM|nr:PhoH family protein [Thermosyntropha lipolytica]SHG85952.1 phosphate starvation-inducible protein PhoH [Thermosyntropha lipolytica DSM 11003]